MVLSNEFAFIVLILCILSGLASGWLGSMAKNASLRRDITDHDYRLSDLEGRVNREVKIRAQQASTKAKDLDREILALAGKGEQTKPELNLQDWRSKMFLRK